MGFKVESTVDNATGAKRRTKQNQIKSFNPRLKEGTARKNATGVTRSEPKQNQIKSEKHIAIGDNSGQRNMSQKR